MGITKIDKNFQLKKVTEKGVIWQQPLTPPFKLYGVYYDNTNGEYCRMPKDIASQVNEGVQFLYSHTAGGRIRFKTNSTCLCLQCQAISSGLGSNLTIAVTFGFAVYVDGKYYANFAPLFTDLPKMEWQTFSYDGHLNLDGQMHDIDLYMPLYNGVSSLYIGLKEGCDVLPPREYTHTTPVLFLGSSITQGGCASRPGNDYISHLSRWLDTDILNFGFSGSCRGEKVMVDYIKTLNPSVFVLDYDYNAPTVEHLEKTHLALYKAFRENHPDTPIVIISSCSHNSESEEVRQKRLSVIKKTYEYGLSKGEKVYFINGRDLFTDQDRDACTVDNCHPNDLGFYRMAKGIYPILNKLLNEK